MNRFAEGQRKPSTCQWCHSPIWIVYHGPNRNHTEEPRTTAEPQDVCEKGMCWAESLKEACDHWKQEAESARVEVTVWKERLVRETERLRSLLEEVRSA